MVHYMGSIDKYHDGNRFFKHQYASIDLEYAITCIDSFADFEKYYTDDLMDGNVLLKEYLTELLSRHNMKADTVSQKIGFSHDYVRKIANGERTNPDREVLLAVCVYIHATVEETQLLLRYAGQQPLSARRKRDAIIWYALMKKQDFSTLNDYLYLRGYDTLGKH